MTIAAFAPTLTVITSKQRPRKLTIHGSDGAEYVFLLKGHEDLRQDERVMQLFGLVNSLLAGDAASAARGLSIARYAVIPLSPNSGLIGWVPNCDTLHALIREFRDARRTPLNAEHRLMLGMAPDYDALCVIQKVEVFEHALDSTSGDDVKRVMWLKSRNSEVWLERRTAYTRSCAVMSIVGYLLGLGDRHPSNLMLDRYSGKLLHIDFGDCFEASMHREKFPERVPFRLTRMMVRAMEAAGIEGNFRFAAETTARVLRSHKDSVLAMLEAFVHDPLINWRLLNTAEGGGGVGAGGGGATGQANAAAAGGATAAAADVVGNATAEQQQLLLQQQQSQHGISFAEQQSAAAGGDPSTASGEQQQDAASAADAAAAAAAAAAGDANEALNERAVAVMKRTSDKLTGRDWDGGGSGSSGAAGAAAAGVASSSALPASAAAQQQQQQQGDPDSVAAQVDRLISQATSHENLCQSYIGWCPFW